MQSTILLGAASDAANRQTMCSNLDKIDHFVVLMLENRSFDHLLGYLKTKDARIDGVLADEFFNFPDPNVTTAPPVKVGAANRFDMPFDPGHEFKDVQVHLYGEQPNSAADPVPNGRLQPPPMSGFLAAALHSAAKQSVSAPQASNVMACFQPSQIPVIAQLAEEFAVFNYWHSSLPGPTWPNRFFVHAATSGGLTDSPNDPEMIVGYSFKNGTIYKRLQAANKDWRIYHEGLPQTAGIGELRLDFLDPFTDRFTEMEHFQNDVKNGKLAAYTFIEPHYDTGNNYLKGNSMHPLNDVRRGEVPIKQVYETLRNSAYWDKVMLIITFDEHGGFYDHVPPPPAVATGDDSRYADAANNFGFDLLGVRVPAIVVSPYTRKGTVVGQDSTGQKLVFDHTSILRTVEKRFNLQPLTKRDAQANTLEIALNLSAPSSDSPTTLAEPLKPGLLERFLNLFRSVPPAAKDDALLSKSQKSMVALAMACDLQLSDSSEHVKIKARHEGITTQAHAQDYLLEVEGKVHTNRAGGRDKGRAKP